MICDSSCTPQFFKQSAIKDVLVFVLVSFKTCIRPSLLSKSLALVFHVFCPESIALGLNRFAVSQTLQKDVHMKVIMSDKESHNIFRPWRGKPQSPDTDEISGTI